jgi:AraC-like DNA-binding protein
VTAGRPRKEIDNKIFENLCGLQCTLEEIAGVFDCSPDTIERWCKREYKETFAEIYKKHSAKGKTSLRRTQFKLAEKSAAMAIFLGKNYLGQKDNIIETDEQTLQAVGEALVKIKRAAEKAENDE